MLAYPQAHGHLYSQPPFTLRCYMSLVQTIISRKSGTFGRCRCVLRSNVRFFVELRSLIPQANSLLLATVLLLLQPIQIEEVNLVFQIGGLIIIVWQGRFTPTGPFFYIAIYSRKPHCSLDWCFGWQITSIIWFMTLSIFPETWCY